MRAIGASAVLPAVLAALLGAGSAAQAAGALAVGQCDRWGYSYNQGSLGGAREAAISYCAQKGDTTCRVVATMVGACAAFAVDGECGARGWGTGASRSGAEGHALHACANYGGENCTVRAWVCDGG